MACESEPDQSTEVAELFDQLPIFAWRADATGTITSRNRSFDAYVGNGANLAIAGDWERDVHGEDADALLSGWRHAVALRVPYAGEARLRRHDGSFRWFSIRAHPQTSMTSASAGWIGTCVEIQRQKDAERAQRENEHWFRGLYDANLLPVGIATLGGRLIDANDALLALLGYSRDDLRDGLRWDEITPPEWAAVDALAVTELRSTGTARVFEKEYVRKDGRRVRVRLGAVRVSSDPEPIAAFYAVDVGDATRNDLLQRITVELSGLTQTASTTETAGAIAQIAKRALGVECVVALADGEGALRVCATTDRSRVGVGAPLPPEIRGAHERAFRERRTIMQGAQLAVPLDVGDDLIGTMCFAKRDTVRFERALEPLCEVFAARAAIAIRARQRFERQRHIADALQAAQLPRTLPTIDGYRVAATYAAAESESRIGGDWYDLFVMPDGKVGISIGDVIGSGLTAGIAMGKLRQSMQAAAVVGAGVTGMLTAAEYTLRRHDSDALASALAAILDPSTGDLAFVSAGHPGPIVDTDGAVHVIATSPIPLLGATPEPYSPVPVMLVRLEPGDRLLFYTDGLIEYDRDVVHGERQLLLDWAAAAGSPDPAVAVLNSTLRGRRSHDDVAVLSIERTEARRMPASASPTRWRFAPTAPAAVVASKDAIMRHLRAIVDDAEGLFDTELIVGELLTNVLKHAPGVVEIEFDWSRDAAVLQIVDSGPGLSDAQFLLPDDDSEGGRGLFIVRRLAKELSIVQTGTTGTQLRVVLPLRRRE